MTILYQDDGPLDVVIGVISAGNVHLACVESIVATVTCRAVRWCLFHRSGPYLDDARNMLVDAFCQPQYADCSKLLMVDSDIQFTPDDVRRLAAHDLPIVSGVYHSQYQGGVYPVVYDWTQDAEGRNIMGHIEDWGDGWPIWTGELPEGVDPLVPAHGVGAGFLMMSRDALDQIGKMHDAPCKWFAEPVRGGVHFGEDLEFCLRAEEAGLDVMVDRSVRVGHHKTGMF